MTDACPQLSDIQAASARIAPYVTRTPVMTSRVLDAKSGARVHFKCENFQRIGAFKARGAAFVDLKVREENEAARSLYDSLGMVIVGREPG